jgi:hypothetical protein
MLHKEHQVCSDANVVHRLSLSAVLAFRLASGQPAAHQLKTVRQQVQETKMRRGQSVTLPHVVVEYRSFEGLENALRTFALLRAVFRTNTVAPPAPADSHLYSYLQFDLIEQLSGPPLQRGPMPQHVPAALRTPPPGRFLIFMPGAGTTRIEGILVKSEGDPLDLLTEGREYLLFAGFPTLSLFGGFAFELGGVFRISPAGALEAVRPADMVARAFHDASLLTLGNVRAHLTARNKR